MPLRKGNKARSKKGMAQNYTALRKEGKKRSQAIAIMLKLAGRSKKGKKRG
jgi:hypothetical protein